VAFIVVQNLVGIDTVISVICMFLFGEFDLKMPLHAPENGVFGEFDPINGKVYQQNPH